MDRCMGAVRWIETTKEKRLSLRLRFKYFQKKMHDDINSVHYKRVTRLWYKPFVVFGEFLLKFNNFKMSSYWFIRSKILVN